MISQIINFVLGLFKLRLQRTGQIEEFWRNSTELKRSKFTLDFLKSLPPHKMQPVFSLLPNSKGQFHQDLMVLAELDFVSQGYFVEFGAHDGVHLSNTYLLESQFDWTGILVEPSRTTFNKLRGNRSAKAFNLAVYSESGLELEFTETSRSELSTLSCHQDEDFHASERDRTTVRKYLVPTISLLDLLELNNAPKIIDYLSIDTEGGELEILEKFDFQSYEIKIISVEHNFGIARKEIERFLVNKSYVRKYKQLDMVEDWYFLE